MWQKIVEFFKALFAPIPESQPVPVDKPVDPDKGMPWMGFMRAHLGETEIAGDKANPFIVALFKHTTYKTNSDETPWCAATVCAALEETGFSSPKSAAAISFKNYGAPCELQPGCIVVIEHSNGKHHVTFCNNVISPKLVRCLGGNQSNSLKLTTYTIAEGYDKIIATRWPTKVRQ